MSDTKKITIDTIPPEAITTIKVSGMFYKKLMSVYMSYFSKLDQLKVIELGKAIGTAKIDELPEEDQQDAVSLQTFTILLRTLDEAFKADGLMVPEEHEIPNEG